MTRKRQLKRETGELRSLRRLTARIDTAMEAAPPDKAAAMLPRAMELARRLADAEADAEDSEAAVARYSAQVERLIRERAIGRIEILFRPVEHDFANQARRIADREGGEWETHLPRVVKDHQDFIRRLLCVPRETKFEAHLQAEARAGVFWARHWREADANG